MRPTELGVQRRERLHFLEIRVQDLMELTHISPSHAAGFKNWGMAGEDVQWEQQKA